MRSCSSCGRPTPDEARFCAYCGTPVVAMVPHEVRKVVTILFADIVGSTALGEQLDPESLRSVLSRYFATAKTCLEGHGASVEKFIGDAVMAVFGVPNTHEDDALRAVRGAADLRAAVLDLNDELESTYGASIHLRIGLNTGEVVVGTAERLATGDAVNVAARLEQAAGSDEILLGEATLRLTRDAIQVESVPPLALKGKSEPVPAYRLLGITEGAEAFNRRMDSPLIGRRWELETARSAFERAVLDRNCQLVTMFGPPGIGKSRLAREVASDLGGRAEVLLGRCLPYGDGITFWPLREIFAAAASEADFEAALQAGAAEEIFLAVRRLVEARARERPLVLIVEDIHWAEPTLLDLLEHLVDWVRDAPVLLLCLARPELLDERPTWAAGRPNATVISLDPLGAEESSALIDGLIGAAAFDEAARARIRDVAEGNPLFVEQLVATIADGGRLDRIPSTIQALLAARLDTLAETERDVLERASVVGAEFDWEALARLDPLGSRPSGAILAGLIRKELIRPNEAIEDAFRFRHALIRDTAYEQISKARRADLHERVATWLGDRGEELDELVGYHLEAAYRCLAELGRPGDRSAGLAQRGAGRLAIAGLRAYARGDLQAAVNLLERSVALLPTDDPGRMRLLPVLGRALRADGQMERAEATLAEAVALGDRAGDRGLAADAGVALSDLRFHRPAYTGVGREDVLREVELAIQTFEELGDEAGLGRALCLGGKLRFWAGDAQAAARDFERAAQHSSVAGDRAEEAEGLRGVISAMVRGPMPVDQALEKVAAVGPRAKRNLLLARSVRVAQAQLEAMSGHFEAARALLTEDSEGASGILQASQHAVQTLPAQGYVELAAGNPGAAEIALRAACEGMERSGELGYLSSVAPLLVDALHQLGRDVDALAASDRWQVDRLTVKEDVDAQSSWRRTRAKVLARRGEFAEALRLGQEAVDVIAETDFLEVRADALADLAEVLELAEQPEQAALRLKAALELYETKGNVAAAARVRARIARMEVAQSPPVTREA